VRCPWRDHPKASSEGWLPQDEIIKPGVDGLPTNAPMRNKSKAFSAGQAIGAIYGSNHLWTIH
jgi:hypothetical protein